MKNEAYVITIKIDKSILTKADTLDHCFLFTVHSLPETIFRPKLVRAKTKTETIFFIFNLPLSIS